MSRNEADVNRLTTLSSAELRDEWRRAYRAEAPNMSSPMLRMGIAYRWQEKSIGSLPARHARRLAADKRPMKTSPNMMLSPGTQLVRSWNGRTLSVAVTEAGFIFEDRTYRSLSAIAREVTGTAWSGPRFFGLKDKARG